MAGRPKEWAGLRGRRLILDMNALRAQMSLSKRKAINQLNTQPPWNTCTPDSLWQAYKSARRVHGDSPVPIAANELIAPQSERAARKQSIIDAKSRDRWTSELQEWGKETKRLPACMSAERARNIIERLIEVSSHWHAQLDRLFVHMERRIHWNGRQKIKWIEDAIDRLGRNPFDWPIPPSQRGRPDVTAGRIESYLREVGSAHKQDIAAALEIPLTTAQTTLCSMERAKRILREANGVYAPWTEGRSYVATDKAILEFLANGQAGLADVRARTGKSDAAIHGALHRLKKKGTIVLTRRGRYAMYALAGTAPLHVYSGDAIDRALESGSKTLPELETVTGKKRGELWAALLRKEAKGEVVKAYLINVGHRGRLAAFAAAPAHR
jgi:hypothetical protein